MAVVVGVDSVVSMLEVVDSFVLVEEVVVVDISRVVVSVSD